MSRVMPISVTPPESQHTRTRDLRTRTTQALNVGI